jgi:poly-gamma-glutamate synthesis protein (capsule biosynthesis protein)
MPPEDDVSEASPDAVRILVGGDVSFDTQPRAKGPVGVLLHKAEHRLLRGLWRKVRLGVAKQWPSVLPFRRYQLAELASYDVSIRHPVKKNRADEGRGVRTGEASAAPPASLTPTCGIEALKPVFAGKDVVMVNLETPLADQKARVTGRFRSDPSYANALAQAGVSIAGVANNHVFDALEEGLLQTIRHLEEAGIAHVGFGRTLDEARTGTEMVIKGTKFRFLAYTQYCNTQFASIAADYPGILPLDRDLIVEDIRRAKKTADLVLVSCHWGLEDQPHVQKRQINYAHEFIDAGADAIIGHHPHVPHGIEVYKERPILYSLGNLVFGCGSDLWIDNFLAEMIVEDRKIRGLSIYPTSGRGNEIRDPRVLKGARARAALEDIRSKSAPFGTTIAICDDRGYIEIDGARFAKGFSQPAGSRQVPGGAVAEHARRAPQI